MMTKQQELNNREIVLQDKRKLQVRFPAVLGGVIIMSGIIGLCFALSSLGTDNKGIGVGLSGGVCLLGGLVLFGAIAMSVKIDGEIDYIQSTLVMMQYQELQDRAEKTRAHKSIETFDTTYAKPEVKPSYKVRLKNDLQNGKITVQFIQDMIKAGSCYEPTCKIERELVNEQTDK